MQGFHVEYLRHSPSLGMYHSLTLAENKSPACIVENANEDSKDRLECFLHAHKKHTRYDMLIASRLYAKKLLHHLETIRSGVSYTLMRGLNSSSFMG